jgi:NADH-quinone oxidoreductase subunit G
LRNASGHPDALAALGFAIARQLDPAAPAGAALDAEAAAFAARVTTALGVAKRPLIVAGTALRSRALLDAAANIAQALHARGQTGAGLTLAFAEANTVGVSMLGGLGVAQALAEVAAPR